MRRTSVSANRVHGFGRVMLQNVGRAVYRGGGAPSQTASSQTPQRCLGPLGYDERPITMGLKSNCPHDTYDDKKYVGLDQRTMVMSTRGYGSGAGSSLLAGVSRGDQRGRRCLSEPI